MTLKEEIEVYRKHLREQPTERLQMYAMQAKKEGRKWLRKLIYEVLNERGVQ